MAATDFTVKDASDVTQTFHTETVGGKQIEKFVPADPADASPIKAASQSDVAAIATALVAKATEATLSSLVSSMATLIAQAATEATLVQLRDRLPSALSVTDPTALPLPRPTFSAPRTTP